MPASMFASAFACILAVCASPVVRYHAFVVADQTKTGSRQMWQRATMLDGVCIYMQSSICSSYAYNCDLDAAYA